MSPLYTLNGLLLRVGNALAAGENCCCGIECDCPDIESLCIQFSLTDYNGDTQTVDNEGLFFYNNAAFWASDNGYNLTISCVQDNGSTTINISVGWAGFIEDCACTSAVGGGQIECVDNADDWYVSTVSGTIEWADSVPCDNGCPANLGSFSVAIANGPC